MEQFQELVGYDLTAWGVEMKAAKSILKHYTVEDALACWQYMTSDSFWDGKHCGLMTVNKNLGPWIKAGKPKDNGRGQRGTTGRYNSGRGKTDGWTDAEMREIVRLRDIEEASGA